LPADPLGGKPGAVLMARPAVVVANALYGPLPRRIYLHIGGLDTIDRPPPHADVLGGVEPAGAAPDVARPRGARGACRYDLRRHPHAAGEFAHDWIILRELAGSQGWRDAGTTVSKPGEGASGEHRPPRRISTSAWPSPSRAAIIEAVS